MKTDFKAISLSRSEMKNIIGGDLTYIMCPTCYPLYGYVPTVTLACMPWPCANPPGPQPEPTPTSPKVPGS